MNACLLGANVLSVRLVGHRVDIWTVDVSDPDAKLPRWASPVQVVGPYTTRCR